MLARLNSPWLQVLVVIRHGESEYNAAAKTGPHWHDPKIFDPSLTPLGCLQAKQLREQLGKELGSNPVLPSSADMLWVTSPLRRCIQTLLLSCPLLPKPAAPGDGGQHPISATLTSMKGCALPKIKVVRCALGILQ